MKNEKNLLTEQELDQVAGGLEKKFIAVTSVDKMQYYLEESTLKGAAFTPDGLLDIGKSHQLELVPRGNWKQFYDAATATGDIWSITKDFRDRIHKRSKSRLSGRPFCRFPKSKEYSFS